jgi:hypothetical protein
MKTIHPSAPSRKFAFYSCASGHFAGKAMQLAKCGQRPRNPPALPAGPTGEGAAAPPPDPLPQCGERHLFGDFPTRHTSHGNSHRIGLALSIGVCVSFIALLGCRQKERTVPEKTLLVQGQGFALRYDPSVFQGSQVTTEPRLTMADIGTDIPIDNAPARVKFAFRAKAPAYLKAPELEPWGEGSIRVIPLHDASVKDFAQSYTGLQKNADSLRAILKSGALRVDKDNFLPDWNCVDEGQTIHAKARILDMPWGSGIQYLTLYTQEWGMPIDRKSTRLNSSHVP